MIQKTELEMAQKNILVLVDEGKRNKDKYNEAIEANKKLRSDIESGIKELEQNLLDLKSALKDSDFIAEFINKKTRAEAAASATGSPVKKELFGMDSSIKVGGPKERLREFFGSSQKPKP